MNDIIFCYHCRRADIKADYFARVKTLNAYTCMCPDCYIRLEHMFINDFYRRVSKVEYQVYLVMES
jgi:hypothetical protein